MVLKEIVCKGNFIFVPGSFLAKVEINLCKEKERERRGGPVLRLARSEHSLNANSNDAGQW